MNNNNIDLEEDFFNYQQIIMIRQYLSKSENLDKVIDFYKPIKGYLAEFKNIINKFQLKFYESQDDNNNNNNYILLDKKKFLKYYNIRSEFKYIDYKYDPNLNKFVFINLPKLYLQRQIEVGENIFNINDNRKYFPLQKGDLCYLTNLSMINVIIWLIEIGFYDYCRICDM